MSTFRTYESALAFYKLCKLLRLPYYLKDQLLRAASSIALNLAEGSCKESKKEQKRFYSIAYASLRECIAVFDLNEVTSLNKEADSLSAMIFCLIKSRT